jgi:hypothetical protein
MLLKDDLNYWLTAIAATVATWLTGVNWGLAAAVAVGIVLAVSAFTYLVKSDDCVYSDSCYYGLAGITAGGLVFPLLALFTLLHL